MDNKLESDRGSHCSKSARQRQYAKRLRRVQASTRAKMLRGPSRKRPPELRPPVWRLPLFFTLLSPREPNVPTRQHHIYKDAEQDSPKVHNQHEINDLVKAPNRSTSYECD